MVLRFCYRVDDKLRVQITDNALSRDLFPADYHCLGDNENRPVKWLSIEGLTQKTFSTASDVVSWLVVYRQVVNSSLNFMYMIVIIGWLFIVMIFVNQWSFGVLLWELTTLAQQPYVEIDPFEIAAYLRDGYRLAQPVNCPDELWVILKLDSFGTSYYSTAYVLLYAMCLSQHYLYIHIWRRSFCAVTVYTRNNNFVLQIMNNHSSEQIKNTNMTIS